MRPLSLAAAATVALVLAASPAAAQPQPANEPPTPAPTFVPPERGYTYLEARPYPSAGWVLLQLIPSPELAFGKNAEGESKTAFGLRWQLTPVLWSWGVNRRVSGWRFFVVDPLARVSGSIALEQHFEYIAGHVDRILVRPGVKATFPLWQRGEYLSFSIGTSVYAYDDRPRLAHDVGVYVFSGTIGLVGTIAPVHEALTTIATLRIRNF